MQTKKCPCCGREISEDAEFCLYCMTKFVDEDEVEVPQARNKFNKKMSAVLAVILFSVLMLAVVLTFIFKHNNTGNNYNISPVAGSVKESQYTSLVTEKQTDNTTTYANTNLYEMLPNSLFTKNFTEAAKGTSSEGCYDSTSLNFYYVSGYENGCSLHTSKGAVVRLKYNFDGSKFSLQSEDIIGEEKLNDIMCLSNMLLKSFTKQYDDLGLAEFLSSTDNFTEKSENVYLGTGSFDGYSCQIKLDKSNSLHSFYIEFNKE